MGVWNFLSGKFEDPDVKKAYWKAEFWRTFWCFFWGAAACLNSVVMIWVASRDRYYMLAILFLGTGGYSLYRAALWCGPVTPNEIISRLPQKGQGKDQS